MRLDPHNNPASASYVPEFETFERVAMERLRLSYPIYFGQRTYPWIGGSQAVPTQWLETLHFKLIDGGLLLEAEIARQKMDTIRQPVALRVPTHMVVTLPATWWDHLKSCLPRPLRRLLGVRTRDYRWPLELEAEGEVVVDVWANLPKFKLPPPEFGPRFYQAIPTTPYGWVKGERNW